MKDWQKSDLEFGPLYVGFVGWSYVLVFYTGMDRPAATKAQACNCQCNQMRNRKLQPPGRPNTITKAKKSAPSHHPLIIKTSQHHHHTSRGLHRNVPETSPTHHWKIPKTPPTNQQSNTKTTPRHHQKKTETRPRQDLDNTKERQRHHRDITGTRPRHPEWIFSRCMRDAGPPYPCKAPSLSILGKNSWCVYEVWTDTQLESFLATHICAHTALRLLRPCHIATQSVRAICAHR